ncbi:hypothetical protein MLD38_021871 [Melastoma candidum]|nr:hypothetical protein MLD38_021871 [Melastoma candidum]
MRSLGVSPDGYSFVGLVSGFTDSKYMLIGQGTHALCLRSGYVSHDHVGSAFVSMYVRFKVIDLASKVFNELFAPDLVAWSALLTGYCQCGDSGKALSIFRKMNSKSWKEDRVLMAGVVVAVAQLANAKPGKEIHASVIRHNLDSEVIIFSTLVDMYMKCGKWDTGLHVFKNMVEKNTVAYNSVISGLGLHGQASKAFVIFEEMLLDVRVRPDAGTFSALLSACYHAGLGKEGREVFRRMMDEFCIPPMTEHYVYMVKILGMEGELEVACNFVKALPVPVDPGIWGALLSCCEMHGDTIMADFVARQLYRIEPEKVAYQVMLSNIYAGNERWSDVKKLRDGIGVERSKTPGMSMVY